MVRRWLMRVIYRQMRISKSSNNLKIKLLQKWRVNKMINLNKCKKKAKKQGNVPMGAVSHPCIRFCSVVEASSALPVGLPTTRW